jgi:hypothetical protein
MPASVTKLDRKVQDIAAKIASFPMNEPANPYRPTLMPREDPSSDPRLTRAIVQLLVTWRRHPPSVFAIMMNWRSMPMLVGAGVLSVLLLRAADLPESVLPVVGIYLGMAIAYTGLARRAARSWPIQKDLFDWPKIEKLARELGIEE